MKNHNMTTFAPAVDQLDTRGRDIVNNTYKVLNILTSEEAVELMRLAELFENSSLVTYSSLVLFQYVHPDPAGEILRLSRYIKENGADILTGTHLKIPASVAKTGKERHYPITGPYKRFASTYPIELYPMIPFPRDDAEAARSPETNLKNALARFRRYYLKQTGRPWIRDGLRRTFKAQLPIFDGYDYNMYVHLRETRSDYFYYPATDNENPYYEFASDKAKFWSIAPTSWPKGQIVLEEIKVKHFRDIFTREDRCEFYRHFDEPLFCD
ncbi:hypothetical protein IEN85_19330 [Pelagicoccus sp. NFK12]|uniref:Uncharacterized protein n=1 Tax=Pelagicoccus enzymogenes TaxID=2773457 RepID=A0A927IGY0_9BACT|nr:hypothetical protein [Pelagicoccus enzymogenes]MBD5781662.1 hypothetical protein [Pelagicoccus enzymogenes]